MTDPRVISESIPLALHGERIDRVVALIADISRRRALALIRAGGVMIDGEAPEKPSTRVEADSTVTIEVPDDPPGIEPDPSVELDLVHIDDDVIVVDKPAHLVVHPGSGVKTGTLANGLLAAFPEIAGIGDDPARPGIVHRLDKGTSGLLMVARTDRAYRSLVQQLAVRSVSRLYRTLVVGLIESESGLIDAPLGRSLRDATRRAVVAGGRPARTRYRVLQRFPITGCSLVECRLETGRTHQIRAHLSAIGHPVVGDERYRGEAAGAAPAPSAALRGMTRPFLHAAELGFEHPVTSASLRFRSPLPDDLSSVLRHLEAMDGEGGR